MRLFALILSLILWSSAGWSAEAVSPIFTGNFGKALWKVVYADADYATNLRFSASRDSIRIQDVDNGLNYEIKLDQKGPQAFPADFMTYFHQRNPGTEYIKGLNLDSATFNQDGTVLSASVSVDIEYESALFGSFVARVGFNVTSTAVESCETYHDYRDQKDKSVSCVQTRISNWHLAEARNSQGGGINPAVGLLLDVNTKMIGSVLSGYPTVNERLYRVGDLVVPINGGESKSR